MSYISSMRLNFSGVVKIIWFILIASLLSASLQAGEFKGTVYSDWYGFTQKDSTYLELFGGVRGNWVAWQNSNRSRLDVRGNVRWTNDPKRDQKNRQEFYIYELFAKYSNPRTELALGRQFVYNDLHSTLIDGFRSRLFIKSHLSIVLFAGTQVLTSDPTALKNFSDFGVSGLRVGYEKPRSFRSALNWIFSKIGGDVSMHSVGAELEKNVNHWQLTGRTAYNIEQSRISDALIRIVLRPNDWYVSGEVRTREPSISHASIFSILEHERYRLARIEARRKVWKSVSLGTQARYSRSIGHDAWNTTLTLSSNNGSIGWNHQSGYGGESDGFLGALWMNVSSHIDVYASTNLNRYRVQNEQSGLSDSYGSTVGLSWRSKSGFVIRSEVQWFQNATQSSDVRYYLRLSKDFSLGGTKPRGES